MPFDFSNHTLLNMNSNVVMAAAFKMKLLEKLWLSLGKQEIGFAGKG